MLKIKDQLAGGEKPIGHMKLNVLLSFLAALVFAAAASAAPTITYFTPTYGSSSDLSYIYIHGSGFSPGTLVVKYGGVNGVQDATAYATQTDLIQSRVPAGASSGPIYVSVNGVGVLSGTSFTVVGTGPYIDSFTPSGGAAGTPVTITGTHFTSGSGGSPVVKLNGKVATQSAAASENALYITVPAGATTGFITVERSGMTTASSSVPFYVNPVIKSFSPVNGRAGTNVVIQGTNFTGALSVWFGNIAVSNLLGVASNQITVAVPAGAITAPLYVYTPAPNPGYTSSNFVVLPLITSFSPIKGPTGTSVTIYGENLWGATNVLFGGVKATPSSVSYSQLSAVVPSGATNGFITVQTTNGSYTVNQLFSLPPRITSFTPTNGPTGTTVKITGTNFLGATDVTFNGTPATSFVVTNNGVIGAVVPDGVITGPIYVTTLYGTTNSGTNLVFYGAPIISGFTPTHGLPGTNVTILGTNFSGVTAVSFNGTSATFGVTNGILTTVVPANAATGPVSVTGPSGTTVSVGSFVLDYASDLGVSVSAPANVHLTNTFTYIITVTNRGPSAAPAVFLTNTLPGSVQFQFGSINPSSGRSFVTTVGNPIIANLGTIAVSNAVTVTLTVKPQATGLISDTAVVVGGYTDPVSTNNTSTASTTVYVIPVLAVQTPSANQIQISWSVLLSDYILQYSTNLVDTNAWSDVQTAPDYVGDQKVVTETIGSGMRFYRLKQQ
jgi:hypothetical protein